MQQKNQTKARRKLLEKLKKSYPDATCELNYNSPEQLLVATILSAQCTDERVNKVTPALFKRFPTLESLAGADIGELEELIRSTGFYKNKAKNIKNCAQQIIENHGGQIPRNLEEFVKLSGVGRKTANVVLGNAFHIPSGIVVDTHVGRLSRRFAWTKSENAEIIERELLKWVPEEDWIGLPHWLIHHGRRVCKARKPVCENCVLNKACPKKGV